MRYEPGMLALCIDPSLPKQMVTLVKPDRGWFAEPAWLVRFPAPILWPVRDVIGDPWEQEGWVAQRFLILLPDADPVETETEQEVMA